MPSKSLIIVSSSPHPPASPNLQSTHHPCIRDDSHNYSPILHQNENTKQDQIIAQFAVKPTNNPTNPNKLNQSLKLRNLNNGIVYQLFKRSQKFTMSIASKLILLIIKLIIKRRVQIRKIDKIQVTVLGWNRQGFLWMLQLRTGIF